MCPNCADLTNNLANDSGGFLSPKIRRRNSSTSLYSLLNFLVILVNCRVTWTRYRQAFGVFFSKRCNLANVFVCASEKHIYLRGDTANIFNFAHLPGEFLLEYVHISGDINKIGCLYALDMYLAAWRKAAVVHISGDLRYVAQLPGEKLAGHSFTPGGECIRGREVC